uniref:Uncharacterized protein n=1 Tax=Romanomermis culicivorax TaxID=13658 RepID=A0A915KY31_ROMCU
MEKEDNIYTIFVDFQSQKSSTNNHIIYDTNLWPSIQLHSHLFAEYAAECVCQKLAAKDEILTPQAASGIRKKRSKMIVILTVGPITLTILLLGAGAGQIMTEVMMRICFSGTLAPVALGAKKMDDVKRIEKSTSAKKDTVNDKQPGKLTTKNIAKV